MDGLAPNDDVQPTADKLEQAEATVMVVGHLPFLSRLASYLILGDPGRAVVRVCNAGVVGLTQVEAGWLVSELLTPQWA